MVRSGRVGLLTTSLALVLLGAGGAAGHGGGFMAQGSPARVHQELIELFGEDAAFSATAVLTSKKPTGDFVEKVGYHLSHGVLRLDRGSDGNPFLTEAQKESRRQHGADVWYNVMRPDSNTLVFPKRKAYVVIPDTGEPLGRITHESLGADTLDGRACVKERVTVDNGDGPTAVLVWRPKDDPKGVPLRIENDHGDSKYELDFEDVQLAEPPAALFDAPEGFTQYKTIGELTDMLHSPPK
jgi:hypothetical protein